MANTSILAAFERMRQHIVVALAGKAELEHEHNNVYYTETEVDTLLANKADDEELPIYLTQAEYDALPDTKLTDDKLYMITDADAETGGSFDLDVLDTMAEVISNTEADKIAGALAVKELNQNVDKHFSVNISTLTDYELKTAIGQLLSTFTERGTYSGRFKCADGWFTLHCYYQADTGSNSGYVNHISTNKAYLFGCKTGADATLVGMATSADLEVISSELNTKPSVHYGTSEPSSSLGEVGDLYVMYEE